MLKKSKLKPWQKKQWCIGQVDGEYLAAMEDVLEVYEQPGQQACIRLCLDERPCQLLDEVISPLPMKEARPLRQDYEYERKGSCVVFMMYDIDKGVRYGKVSERRTKADYAAFVEEVLSQHYPRAAKVELVQDNLNTHKYGSFYEYLPVERASALRRLINFHYTPKHGSWLNMVEIEFSALCRQCLDRRIASLQELDEQMQAWIKERNEKQLKIHWSFTVKEARNKLAPKYAKLVPEN
jgi:hypothetical protein